MSSFDYLDLCRLCLVKDQVSVPIFEGDGDARQIFHKISFCLPVKVDREDKLPKKICDDCAYKVELCYQFYNTTANAEKQLLQWLGEVGLEDKQDYEQEVMNSDMMKQEPDNRINVTVLSSEEQSNNMEINMIDGMSLSLPIIMTNQQMPAVSMSSTDNLQNIQSVAGTSVQTTRRMQKDGGHEEIEDTEEDDNSEDECDVDEGMQVVKEESENSTSGSRSMEPTTFVNVALSCNEAGPSGLQQQKLGEISEMGIQQSSEGDTKTGYNRVLSVKKNLLLTKSLSVLSKKKSPVIYENEIIKFCGKEKISVTISEIKKPKGIKIGSKKLARRKKIKKKQIVLSSDEEETSALIKLNKNKRAEEFKCEICGSSFNLKSKLKSHMLRHSNSRPYKCAMCFKNFKTNVYLNKHMETHREQTEFFSCSVCDFKAKSKAYLKIHFIRKHTDEYNYQCEDCGKKFKVLSDFTTHMKDHSTESCVCDICGSSYPNKSSLYFHKYYKHKLKIKEYECVTCKKKFKSQRNLNSHAELHSIKYVCEQCGVEFKFKQGLTKHLKTHSGEKSCLCAICGKTFSSLSSQKVHLLTHAGERPYVCDICGQSFTQRSPMMLHRKKHPGVHPKPPPIRITELLHGVKDKVEDDKQKN